MVYWKRPSRHHFSEKSKPSPHAERVSLKFVSYMVLELLSLLVMLFLLRILLFFEAVHAEGTVVFDLILCQASLARFALSLR